MTQATSKRDAVIKRIKALLARAGDAGSTYDEAIFAARKAAEMMDEWELSEADIDSHSGGRDAGYEKKAVRPGAFWQEKLYDNLAVAVGDYCGAYVYRRPLGERQRRGEYVFYGALPDVTLAHWMTDMLANFILTGCERDAEKSGCLKSGGKLLNEFRNGYLITAGVTLSKRLRNLIAERNRRYRGSTLPALMDRRLNAKTDLIKAGVKIVPSDGKKKRTYMVPSDSINQGRQRAEAAPLNPAFSGANETPLLSS